MAYSADKKPGELTALSALATDDVFVVGDTSDTTEVAKYITKANLLTDFGATFEPLKGADDNFVTDAEKAALHTAVTKAGTATYISLSGQEITADPIDTTDLAAGVLDTDLSSVSASDDTVPSAKATKAALDLKAPLVSPTFTTPTLGAASGTSLNLSGLTASEIVITDASKNLASAAVATYPSLTELSYVKGVTSAIQTQINGISAPEGTAVKSTGEVGGVKFLREDGDGTCSWQVPAGSGDVSKVGTPVNNQVGVWTGDGTIEGDAALTFDTTTDTLTTGTLNATALTASEIAATDASKNIVSLAVATYPSLTELTYVKGVTSALQTQLNAKAPLASPTFTGTVTLPVGLTGVIRTDTGVVSVDTDVTDIVAAASDTVAGKVELATAAETTTGTDAARAVTPDGLAGSTTFGRKTVSVQVTDGTTDVATGDGKAYLTIPESLNGMNLVRAQATVVTAGTTNATTVMIHNKTDAADMLSGAISIASGGTVGTVGTVNGATDDVATNDVLRIDVDSVSTTAPKGLMVVLEFQLP